MDNSITLDDGSEIILNQDGQYVIVRSPFYGSPEAVLDNAFQSAQCALDILGIQGQDSLAIHGGYVSHFMWWRERQQTVLRATIRETLNFSMSVNATVIRADGSVEEEEQIQRPKWHPAFRYFRIAQTTSDLYESYRNMYLAFEAILSSIVPRDAREREGDWLRRALEVVSQQLNIQRYVALSQNTASAIDAFMNDQYSSKRCALMHAKTGQGAVLPGGIYAERLQVARDLSRLRLFVLDLARTWLGVQIGGGVITVHGFAAMIKPLENQLEIAVSEDGTEPDAAQTAVSPAGLPVITLPTTFIGRVDDIGMELGFVGRSPCSTGSFPVINTIASQINTGTGTLLSLSSVDSLSLEDIDEFEVLLIMVMNNRSVRREGFIL